MSVKFKRGDKIFILKENENPKITISPLNTSQTSTGSINFTVSPIGNVGSMTYNWSAKDTSGTSLTANITGSGASVTFNTRLPKQTITVTVTGTDSNKPDLPAYATALVSVGDPAALIPPQALSESLTLGTTSASFSFGTASGGFGTISYGLTGYGPGTLTTSSARNGTINSLANNDISKVVLTCTDQFGQVATSSYVVGIGADPVFKEEANWNTIFEIDFTNIGTGSLSAAGSLTLGGNTITMFVLAGTPTHSINVDSQGMKYTFTGSTGATATSAIRIAVSGGISNYAPAENILTDIVYYVDNLEYPAPFNYSIGDGTNINDLDSFGIRNYWVNATTASIDARRYQSATAFTQSLGSYSTHNLKTFAGQILLVSQRVPLMTIKEASNYLDGPKLGTSTPMRGTWTGTAGGSGPAAATTLTSAFSTINIHLNLSSIANTPAAKACVFIKKIRFRRLSRPPSS